MSEKESELVLVKSENTELLTVEEMTARLGYKSVNTTRARIAKYGLEPVVPMTRDQHGTNAAKYDWQAYMTLAKSKEEELILQENRQRKIAATLSENGVEMVVRESLESIDNPQDMLGVTIMMLQKMQDFLKDTVRINEELKAYVEELESKLDMAENEMTVEQYCIRNGYSNFTRAMCGAITKKLHAQGLNEVRVIASPQSGMPACVWHKDTLDAYFADLARE